jgi:hypothetical protein
MARLFANLESRLAFGLASAVHLAASQSTPVALGTARTVATPCCRPVTASWPHTPRAAMTSHAFAARGHSSLSQQRPSPHGEPGRCGRSSCPCRDPNRRQTSRWWMSPCQRTARVQLATDHDGSAVRWGHTPVMVTCPADPLGGGVLPDVQGLERTPPRHAQAALPRVGLLRQPSGVAGSTTSGIAPRVRITGATLAANWSEEVFCVT